jgi:hypothetical protein
VLAVLGSARASGDSLASTDSFLPIVHVVGATGTYTSTVNIFNPGSSSVAVHFFFTPADTNGSSSPDVRLTPDLPPGASRTFEDMLAAFFAKTGYGQLEVQSSQPILVSSNTINVAASCTGGTFGQFSPGQPLRNAVGFGTTPDYELHAAGIPNDADHKTNAVLMNPTSFTLNATMELVDETGTKLGEVTAQVPPFSLHQFNDVFGAVFGAQSPATGNAFRLTFFVNTQNGARLLAYATIIEVQSGDPYLVTASGSVAEIPAARRPSPWAE